MPTPLHGSSFRALLRFGHRVAGAALLLAAATQGASAAETARVDEAPGYLRVRADADRAVSLDVAVRRYVREDAPDVSLVGVVHVGDAAYYRAVQALLEDSDVVLYESVKPEGTGGAGGETPAARRSSTRAAMRHVARLVDGHRRARGLPPELVALPHPDADPREAAFLEAALLDAWGHPLRYHPDSDADTYRILSQGADAAPGGEGEDADLVLDGPLAEPAPSADRADGIQAQLAAALALRFQLEALDYDHANWRCSDMSVDQIQRAMAERGSDFALVEGTLAGTSFPARVARFLLGLVRVADAFSGGAMSDTLKVVLIEMLGDEALVDASLAQVDPAFAEVIINDRNAVVIEDLERLVEDEPGIRSVAVLYGAGHMADLSRRLEALGYRPEDGRWLEAIRVDVEQSPVSAAEVARLRGMVRRMMGMQRQMQRGE